MKSNVYPLLKGYIPKKICLKSRREIGVTIVMSSEGDLEFINSSGSAFFDLIDGARTIDDICSEMISIYDVRQEVLQDDLICLIRDLQWRRIIEL